MANVIKFEALEVEVLTGIANESAELVEASARKAVEHAERSGRALIAIKEKLPHGEWSAWLGKNFDYSLELARRYMSIASNSTRVLNLKDATSIREALRMIADDPETPKRERKPSVEVIEVASDVPAVESESVTSDEQAVVTVKPMATEKPVVSKPASSPKPATAKAEPEVEKKSPSVIQIQRTLIKMGADKKRHPQLIQIANDALYRLTPDERCEVLTSQLKRLTPEQQMQLISSLKK